MISKAKFVFSKSKIVEEYNNIQKLCDKVCYSVKSNYHITSVLEENTNSEFLIHNISSLKHVKDTSKILFMLHFPDTEELEILFNNNISNFIVDNTKDLDLLLDYCKTNNKKINLLLRMKLKEYTVQTGRYFVFGMPSKLINELVLKLKDNTSIEKLGVHFYRKTQNLSEWNIINELKESLTKETLEIIDYLDIGGGIPIKYKNIRDVAIDNITNQILKLKEFANTNNIDLIIEPGRAIAGPSGKLVANIKNIVDNTIFVDASVFNCATDALVYNLKLLIEDEKENGTPYVIKGATPVSEDIFRYRVYLDNPKIGDKLVFINAGAYIYYTDFFDLEIPKIEFVD